MHAVEASSLLLRWFIRPASARWLGAHLTKSCPSLAVAVVEPLSVPLARL